MRGVAEAKTEGKHKGRSLAMQDAGESPSVVANQLRIGRSSVYRAIAVRGTKEQ